MIVSSIIIFGNNDSTSYDISIWHIKTVLFVLACVNAWDYSLHLACPYFYLTGCVEKERVEIFKEDIKNKFECVVIGSRGWPFRYRVDSVIV